MDFLSNLAKTAQPKPTSDQPATDSSGTDHKPSSTTDLLTSAKVVAEAAQAQFRNEPEKYDKEKVAGAAADILDAASQYGKLDEAQGVGKYVEQAEGYLRKYGHTTEEKKTDVPPAAEEKAPEEAKTAAPVPEPEADQKSSDGGDLVKAAEGFLNKPSEGGSSEAGGIGDYVKTAEGFLNKESGGEGAKGESEGGYGDLLKAAGGFLKK